eukprot:NODE_2335_length_1086_cov_45.907195_g2317_i0.p1 GENE.NODE_2335_length_1086_cov_45.907195_g2317_i0~~NODE_2335_length_1086_cov_45.907195_g2317_i0.p1  ORF type:complete len:302 (+),score=61.99 NODE_2335_length_1086_cov_45.907195_g2317_i0:54-959(+)
MFRCALVRLFGRRPGNPDYRQLFDLIVDSRQQDPATAVSTLQEVVTQAKQFNVDDYPRRVLPSALYELSGDRFQQELTAEQRLNLCTDALKYYKDHLMHDQMYYASSRIVGLCQLLGKDTQEAVAQRTAAALKANASIVAKEYWIIRKEEAYPESKEEEALQFAIAALETMRETLRASGGVTSAVEGRELSDLLALVGEGLSRVGRLEEALKLFEEIEELLRPSQFADDTVGVRLGRALTAIAGIVKTDDPTRANSLAHEGLELLTSASAVLAKSALSTKQREYYCKLAVSIAAETAAYKA